jgi:HemY protein
MRFESAVAHRDWRAAEAALAEAETERVIEAAKARHHRAALLIAISHHEALRGERARAVQAAEQAARLMPDWTPATINLTEQLLAAGHRRAALRTLGRGFAHTPHPQLAAVYGDEAGTAGALETFRQITRLLTGHTEASTQLVLGETALAADLWGEARRHLMALVERGEATRKTYQLLAKLERREKGDEAAALIWSAKAGEAPLDPIWLCEACGGAQQEWRVICAHCGAFDSLDWRAPGVSKSASAKILPYAQVNSIDKSQ